MQSATPTLEVRDLRKSYRSSNGGRLLAVDGVSFAIEKGQSFGLAGLSGSGKSTVGRIIMRLTEPDSGEVLFDGRPITGKRSPEASLARSKMQMVFQNPVASMNPRRTARSIIEMPLKSFGIGTASERKERAYELLNLVGLSPRHAEYYPHEFSGGQCQRLGIARALATEPQFLFLDEPVSALDVSIQAQILNLLRELQERFDLTYLIVANNLNVTAFIAERLAIMSSGVIVETGTAEQVFRRPQHQVTRDLLGSILSLDSTLESDSAVERPPGGTHA